MSKDVKRSIIFEDIIEKEQEKYSFYKLDDIVKMVLTLMNAYEDEKYCSKGNLSYGHATIEAVEPTKETKKLVIDTWLLDYLGLQLDYEQKETLMLYGFGPSESRFKLKLDEKQDLDYIQVFADVLFDYRSKNEIEELSDRELESFLKKYLEISKEEIELRKSNKQNNKVMKK